MAYTLLGSMRSPFVRVCRMLMIQNSIEFEFKILNFLEDKGDAELLSKETPINKVPVLIDNGQKIFDSRVIVNYLTKKHGLRTLSLDEENLASMIYSCLDTGVILFLMKRDGFNINHPGFFMTRQRERIPNNLEHIAPWAKLLDPTRSEDWNFVSMLLYSFLYWAEAREVLTVKSYPVLSIFMDKFKEMPGVKETSF